MGRDELSAYAKFDKDPSETLSLAKPTVTNQKFLSLMESATKEFSNKNPHSNFTTDSLDSFLSLKAFHSFNSSLQKASHKKPNSGSYVVKNFQMFDINSGEPLPQESYLKQLTCETKKISSISQSAYKLL